MLKKKIDVVEQMILAAIPLFVTPLYSFYRIKKFKKGVLVLFVVLGIVVTDFVIHDKVAYSEFFEIEQFEKELILTFPYVIGLIITILLPMYFTRKWTLEYNENINHKT